MARGNLHDLSKYEPEEFWAYAEMMGEFEKHPYGSDGYNKAKEALGPAIQIHFKNNRHHPEHHTGGIDGMNLVDVLEMLCDWKSATLNHPERPGNLEKSIEVGVAKYNISPQLAKILYNTAKDFGML